MKKNIRFKPGKGMVMFSRVFAGVFTLIGLSFVFIGVTEILPSGAGMFGVVWTMIACCFVGVGIYGMVNKNGIYGMYRGFGLEIEDEKTDTESVEMRLEKLESLYQQNLITSEEYEEKRKEILKDI